MKKENNFRYNAAALPGSRWRPKALDKAALASTSTVLLP